MSVPWLTQAAQKRPDHPALVFEGLTYSYRQLHEQVQGLADRLKREGIGPSDRVGLLLENSVEWIVWAHALQQRGAALLALNTRLTPRELASQLELTQPARLVVDASHHELGGSAAREATGVPIEIATSATPPEPSSADPQPPVSPTPSLMALEGDLALLFTSGTTGSPKAVRLSARAFLASATLSTDRLGNEPDDAWLACMPLFHVGGLSIVMRSAIAASTLVLHRRFDAKAVAAALRGAEATAISLVPTMLGRVMEHLSECPPRLRFLLLGGGPVPDGLRRRALALGLPLSTTYGLSEACSQVATSAPGDPQPGALPLAETQVVIRRDDGTPLPVGQPGEVCVRGPQLMEGYLDAPGANAVVLRKGWLHTGDIGSLDASGRLFIHDRRKDLIVTGGENVYPAEVEAALCEHTSVEDAAVLGVPDPEWGQRVEAQIVLCQDHALDPAALDQHLRERLAGYKLPRAYAERASLPRTASGKLHRHRLGPSSATEPNSRSE